MHFSFIRECFSSRFISIQLVLICLMTSNPAAFAKVRYGMNMAPSTYYCANGEFVDMLVHANRWDIYGSPPPAGTKLPLTANGYPSSPAVYPGGSPQTSNAACIFSSAGYQSGICNFYGEGDFTVSMIGSFSMVPGTYVHNKGTNVTTCQFMLNAPPTGYPTTYGPSQLIISNINPTGKNPPNNFHLICPGYKPYPNTEQIFTKEFLAMEAPFSISRGHADYSPGTQGFLNETDWNTRVDPNMFSCWGSSYEATIALCNASNTDFWVHVPVSATEDWMKNFAKLVHSSLKPNLHVYVEYANECWNWGYNYCSIIEADDQANPSLDSTGWFRHGQQVAFKTMQIYEAMHSILGSQARYVLMGQMGAMSYTCQAGLDWINRHYGPASNYIYGIGGAAYIGPSSAVPYTDLPSLFASLEASLSSSIIPSLKQCRTLANEYNVKVVCYEGGQGLAPKSDLSDFNFLMSAQLDPGMTTLYTNLAHALDSTGVDEMNFTDDCAGWSQYGYWGNVVDVRQANSSSPKFSTCAAVAQSGTQSPARIPPPAPAKKHHG